MAIVERVRTIHPDGRITVTETIDNSKITVNRKEKVGIERFIFVFQKAILEIVQNAKLGKNDFKILLYLMAKTEFEKEISITPYQISKDLKLQQSPTGVAIRKLCSLNIVIRDKSKKTFRLNYEIAFKGSPKNYNKLKFKDEALLIPRRDGQLDMLNVIDEIENNMK